MVAWCSCSMAGVAGRSTASSRRTSAIVVMLGANRVNSTATTAGSATTTATTVTGTMKMSVIIAMAAMAAYMIAMTIGTIVIAAILGSRTNAAKRKVR